MLSSDFLFPRFFVVPLANPSNFSHCKCFSSRIYIGLGFMVVKPHPVAMIQTPSGVYKIVRYCLGGIYGNYKPKGLLMSACGLIIPIDTD